MEQSDVHNSWYPKFTRASFGENDLVAGRLIRYGFWFVVAVSGIIIALRTLLGSYSFPFPARSPMNAEGCFGLAIVLALIARASDSHEQGVSPKSPQGGLIWLGGLALTLLAAAAFWRAIHFYFLSDDFILVNVGNSSFRPGLRSFFAAEAGYGFYRPIARLSLVLNSTWAKWDPAVWHLTALIIHLANSLLVLKLALRLCASPLAAFFAAALFSLHGSHPETAVWIAGRFDLLATFFVLCALLLFITSLEKTGARGFLDRLLSLACMILAILSKESAYIFPLLLIIVLISKRDPRHKRISALVPFFMVAAGLFVHRWLLFGGIGGYRDVDTGQARVLTFNVIGTLKALLLRMWAVLFFPVNWSIQPGAVFAILMTAYIISLVWLALSRIDRRRLTFAMGFVLVSVLPPLHLLLIGSDLERSRLLYMPSIGFCLMLALAAERLRGRVRWIAPAVILAFNLCALEHNLNVWENASRKAKSACAEAVRCIDPATKKIIVTGLPAILDGVYFFGNGFKECVERQRNGASIPIELRPADAAPTKSEGVRWMSWNQFANQLRCVD